MDPIERKRLENLLSQNYIERTDDQQVVGDKPLIKIQKVTGLDESGGIIGRKLDNVVMLDCGHPSSGRENLGGKCAVCGDLFCNQIIGDRYSCYRRCIHCKRLICLKHVRGTEGDPVYCSLWCRILSNPRILISTIAIVICLLVIILGLIFGN